MDLRRHFTEEVMYVLMEISYNITLDNVWKWGLKTYILLSIKIILGCQNDDTEKR